MPNSWPPLELDEWRETYATLHMWMQVAGKICLALTPRTNHFWNIAFHLTGRGLATPLMHQGDVAFTIEFDFIDHLLHLTCSSGHRREIELEPMSVAQFHRRLMAEVRSLGIEVKIWPVPVEVPDPIRFTADEVHRSYDKRQVEAFWAILLLIKPVLEEFRCDFLGKCSPVHFFWGSFDLAVTRFSGRRAPPRPEMGSMYAEAYSHEVISHGWWPGSGPVQEAAFYAYCVPQPEGFDYAPIQPAAATYHRELGEYILPYDAVRTAASPGETLREFLRTTYAAGADLGHWNRPELERNNGRTL